MRVIVKTVKGETHPIECEGSFTVAQIKAEIQKTLFFESDSQKLIFKGKHLDDSKTLNELEIKDNDCLVLMIMKVCSEENFSEKVEGRDKRSNCRPGNFAFTTTEHFYREPPVTIFAAGAWSISTGPSIGSESRNRTGAPKQRNLNPRAYVDRLCSAGS